MALQTNKLVSSDIFNNFVGNVLTNRKEYFSGETCLKVFETIQVSYTVIFC